MRRELGTFGALVVGILLALIVLAIVGEFVVQMGEMEHYRRVYRKPLYVEAMVTRYEEGDDSTDAYVDYMANGLMYKDVFYESKWDVAELPPIGDTVRIPVSPIDPSKSLEDLEKSKYMSMFLMTFLLMCMAFAWLAVMQSRRSKGVVGMPEPEVLQRDLRLTIYGRFWLAFWVLFTIATVLMYLRYRMILGGVMLLSTIAGAVMSVVCASRVSRDLGYLKAGDYVVKRDVLVDKDVYRHRRCGRTYRLWYSSGNTKWPSSVTPHYYHEARLGDTALAVYLPGKKQPVLHCDRQGDAR